jgi:hypothetical protein
MGDFEHMRLEPWASAGRNQYLQSPVQVGKGANPLLVATGIVVGVFGGSGGGGGGSSSPPAAPPPPGPTVTGNGFAPTSGPGDTSAYYPLAAGNQWLQWPRIQAARC